MSGGSGTDTITDFASGDKIDLTGIVVSSGLGTAVAVLSDGTTLVAANSYNWLAGDFI